MSKKINKAGLHILSLFLLIILSSTAFAQADKSASKAGKQILDSKLMKREMPYNLILPKNYNEKSQEKTKYSVN